MKKILLLSLLIGISGGAVLAALTSLPLFWGGWWAYSLLLTVCVLAVLWGWRSAGCGRALGWMLLAAFVLRLAAGVALQTLLPVVGYDEEVQNAGYVFFDAYQRDGQAWQLAASGQPLLNAFRGEGFISDQYGGLLALSAAVYRLFSPDVHRPVVILILTALFGALGVLFTYRAVGKRWGLPAAVIAGWIMALYPEAILLGASQMREPFLVGLFAAAFWGLLLWQERRRLSVLTLALSLLGMVLISWRMGLVAGGILAVWFGLDVLAESDRRFWRGLGLAAGVVGFLLLVLVSWNWLGEAALWDAHLTWQGSGIIQWVIQKLSMNWRVPVVTAYGLAQPVLPATLADPAAAIWKTINILRALGWYALAPFLLYGIFSVWKAPAGRQRRLLLWLAAIIALWIVLSSARAGGDQWDNPRYRILLLPWMALLTAWAVGFARQRRDPWLVRWLAVEGVFLLLFSNWYVERYTAYGLPLGFPLTVLLVLISSIAILAGSWGWDLWRKKSKIRKT